MQVFRAVFQKISLLLAYFSHLGKMTILQTIPKTKNKNRIRLTRGCDGITISQRANFEVFSVVQCRVTHSSLKTVRFVGYSCLFVLCRFRYGNSACVVWTIIMHLLSRLKAQAVGSTYGPLVFCKILVDWWRKVRSVIVAIYWDCFAFDQTPRQYCDRTREILCPLIRNLCGKNYCQTREPRVTSDQCRGIKCVTLTAAHIHAAYQRIVCCGPSEDEILMIANHPGRVAGLMVNGSEL